MKQPKCRTCSKEHALGICPEFQSTAEEKGLPKAIIAKRGSTGVSVNIVAGREGGTTSVAGTQAPHVDTNSEPFDRKKYQMLFMRDKRKADKLGLKVSEYRKIKGKD